MNRDTFITMCTIMIMIFSSIALGFTVGFNFIQLRETLWDDEYNVTNEMECMNLSLKETAKCLNNYVGEFYVYNITDDRVSLTLDELKTYGGDCKNWANLYRDMARNLGYYSTTVTMKMTNISSHRVALVSDDDSYCLFDQLSYVCNEK